jgi:hypothetical protein
MKKRTTKIENKRRYLNCEERNKEHALYKFEMVGKKSC